MSTKAHHETPEVTSALAPDLEVVSKFISEMLAKGAVTGLIAAILALLVRMRDLNTELMKKLAAKSQGHPPSETMRRLELEQLVRGKSADNAEQTAGAPPKANRKKRGARAPKPHGRPVFPSHLPRVPRPLFVSSSERQCPNCKRETVRICMKPTAQKLDLEPARYIVVQTLVETRACPGCRRCVVTASRPDEVVDRGILGDELLVQALVDHHQDAVPFERMERNARQEGVPLAANTLGSSVGRTIDLFDPVVRHIREACLSSTYTALDATRMPVLDSAHPMGIKNGALWLIEGDHRYACFLYAPSAHAAHIQAFFKDRSLGSVMCDGSPTNNCVETDAGGTRGGCHAHGRRGLVAALRLGHALALEGLQLYGQVFHIDAESKRLGESLDQRFARRTRDSVPAMAALHEWVAHWRPHLEPKSPLGRAMGYLHRQWPRLTKFLTDPLMELTNNEVESDLRPWVLNRKTWLFVGNERSARRAADALTLITTCKKMGIPPRAYLRFALAKLLAGEKSLDALLPEAYLAVHSAPNLPLVAFAA